MKTGYSRLEFIANVESFCWIDLCLFAGSEVDCRSWFLDPFLRTYQDGIEEREYLEGIERLDCAEKSTAGRRRPPLAYRSHDQSMKGPDNNG